MRELLGFVVERLVDNPDAIEIRVDESAEALKLQLKVAPDDLGKVIGRQGRTARSMRTLFNSLSPMRPVELEIVEQ